jgi:hypothetical protein
MHRRHFIKRLIDAIAGARFPPAVTQRMTLFANTLKTDEYGFFLLDAFTISSRVIRANPVVRISLDGSMFQRAENPVVEHHDGIYTVQLKPHETDCKRLYICASAYEALSAYDSFDND